MWDAFMSERDVSEAMAALRKPHLTMTFLLCLTTLAAALKKEGISVPSGAFL
jgi:hypothetical protein